jgi:hypothetical protein
MSMAGALAAAIYRPMLVLWLTLFSVASLAKAESVPPHVRAEIAQAHLIGMGEFTWFGLKIYQASLWANDATWHFDAKDDAKFALDLQYARSLHGERIADASLKEMKRMEIGSPQQQQSWLAAMKSMFPDVEKGTHITGVYLPNHGARFYLNGKLLGEVPDPEFARAFFAIWLDPRTSDQKLRSALLAGSTYK